MDSRTGFIDVNGSGLDLIYLYEPRTSGPAGITTYISQTYSQDLGSIFYMNANLGGLGLTGATGTNCGYKNSFGIDLGSMFCVRGTVAPLVIAFTPLSVSGCSIWLDATDMSTLFTNANGTGAVTGTTTGVKYWKNKAGSTNNATWSTTTPTDNTAGVSYTVGTYPNLNFAGRGSDINMSLTGISDIFVVSSNNSATYGGYYGMIGGGVAGGSSYLFGMQTLTTVSSSALTTTTLYNGGTNPPASVSNINLFEKVGGVGTTLFTPTLGGGLFGIGRGDQNIGYQWQGTIREVLIYTSPMSTSDRINIEGYLAKKWGIQTLLPSYHPYYNALVFYYPFNTDVLNYATGTGVSDGSIVSGGVNCLVQSSIKQFGSGSFKNTTASQTSYFQFPTMTANQNGYTFSFWVYLTASGAGMIWSFFLTTSTRIFCFFNAGYLILSLSGNSQTGIFEPTLNTWYHIAWTCTKGSVNNVYVSIAGGTFGGIKNITITQTYQSTTFNKNYLLSDPFPGVGASGYVDEFYYYDGILNSTQISNLYTANDPGPQLGLLPFLPTGCVGLFACKWVNNGYSGPILKLRKSSDTGGTSMLDFYIDKTGTVITTGVNGTGTSFSTWIGSDTAYVYTWYDQSGLGKHGTQTNTTYQPSYDFTNKRIDFTANTFAFLNLPDGTVPTADSSYTISCKHSPITNNTGINAILNSGSLLNYQMNCVYAKTDANDHYRNDWYNYDNYGGTISTNNSGTVSFMYDNTIANHNNARSIFVNQAAASSTQTYIGLGVTQNSSTGVIHLNTSSYNAIGTAFYVGTLPPPYKFNGSMYNLCIFNNVLSTSNRQIVEQIDSIVYNGFFVQTITTPQAVSSINYVNNWTVSSTSTFFLATTADTTYTRGSSTTSPFVALPTSQFLVSNLAAANTPHNIKQSVIIPTAGIYTLTFYHNGRSGATNPYVTTHTLTVGLASKTVVSALSTTNSGWQLFTGSVALTAGDIGYKDLTLTFNNSVATNSSFFITGVALNYVGPAAGTGLLASLPTGSVGLFACKWINNNYVGPILRLRRSTDTTGASPQDFFMDNTGSAVGTLPNGTGTSFATWLGAAPTAYVVTWYDQSGQFRHAIQPTTTLQPSYDYTNKQIDFTNNANSYFALPDGTVPIGNNSYSVIMKHGNTPNFTTYTKPSYLSSGNFSSGSMTTGFRMANDPVGLYVPAYINYGWNGTTSGAGVNTASSANGKCFANQVITFQYLSSSTTASSYINGTKISESTGTSRAGVSSSNYLGGIPSGYNSGDNNFNTPMYYLSIFNTALGDTDRKIMENIDSLVWNGYFTSPVIADGSVPQVLTTTYLTNWTVSLYDVNQTFYLATPTNGVYTLGTNTTSPYVALPSSINRFLISKIITANSSHTLTQSVNIPVAGIYNITFYYAARPSFYSNTHLLSSLTLNSKVIVSNLQANATTNPTAANTGWRLFSGSVALTAADVGTTRDLVFTFTSGANIDSSYYITGVALNYVGPAKTGLLASLPTGSVGLFACKWVNDGYVGPILKLRRSTDSVTQDFFMDSTGTAVGTLPNGTGTSYATWVDAGTAYVDTWYDQSGVGNHATQSVVGSQPIFNQIGKKINFRTGKFLNLPDSTVPYENSSFTVTYKHGAVDVGSPTRGTILSCGTNQYNLTNHFMINGNNYYHMFFANDFTSSGTYAENNVVTTLYNGTTLNIQSYVNSTLKNSLTMIANNAQRTNNVIGSGLRGLTANNYDLNGDLFYIFITPNILSDVDRIKMETI